MTSTAYIFSSASAWGEPHYIDVTGKRFDYHDQGEFLLLEMGPKHSQLQAIVNYLIDPTIDITVHRSFAFGEPGRFAYQVSIIFISSVTVSIKMWLSTWHLYIVQASVSHSVRTALPLATPC